jgi:hypothetical protein
LWAYEYVGVDDVSFVEVRAQRANEPFEDGGEGYDGAITMDDMLDQQLIEELRQVDLNTLSPFECMSLMFEWKKRYR